MNNRIIKFRVWNEEDNSWCGKAYPGVAIDKNDYDKLEKLIFQQFTGLLDKNGKEIYEGDIVKEGYCQGRAEIVFTDGGFFSKDLKHSWEEFLEEDVNTYEECRSFICSSRVEDMEIIGNIFENPEFLNKRL